MGKGDYNTVIYTIQESVPIAVLMLLCI